MAVIPIPARVLDRRQSAVKTPEEKIKLLTRLADWFYANTNTWECEIGPEIAYLFHAIVKDTSCQWYGTEEIILLLKDMSLPHPITEDDDVWGYINIISPGD